MDPALRPIVVFDSGYGGLSVLKELTRELPGEDFVFFGDSANAPYGPRTTEQIRRLTMDNLAALDREFSFKAAVIACNTATSAAIEELRARYAPRPIIGIEPALKLAADRHPGGRILVLATQATLREEKFAQLAAHVGRGCTVYTRACPELVEFVERMELDGPRVEAYLADLLAAYPAGLDAIVLGCTHFPFVAPTLARLAGPDTELLDGAAGTARQTRRRLAEENLLNATGKGSVRFFSSSMELEILKHAKYLFHSLDAFQEL